MESACSKYLARWREKNGLEDLKKSLSYLRKLISVYGTWPGTRGWNRDPTADRYVQMLVAMFCHEHGMTDEESTIVRILTFWRSGDDLLHAEAMLAALVQANTPIES